MERRGRRGTRAVAGASLSSSFDPLHFILFSSPVTLRAAVVRWVPARRKRGSRRSYATPSRPTLTPSLFSPPFPGNSRQPMGARRRGAPREDRPTVRAAVAPQGQPGDKERKVDARRGRAGTHARAVNHLPCPRGTRARRARVAEPRDDRVFPARGRASRVARPAASNPHATRGRPLTNNETWRRETRDDEPAVHG